MSEHTSFFFPSSSGRCRIHAVQWQPSPDTAPQGVVQILHGVAEHIERYDALGRYLSDHGFVVVGNDHLGHGKSVSSPADYGYFTDKDGWMHVSNDTRTLQIMTARHFPDLPYFLLGHSMGSFLARTYLIRFPGTVSGAILCGTGQTSDALIAAGRSAARLEALRLGRHVRSKLLTQLSFGSYNKRFRPNRTEYDWLSVNAQNVDDYIADPQCGFDLTVGLFLDLMDGLSYIKKKKNLARMKKDTPVLFIAGDQDPVGDAGAGVYRVYQSFRAAGMSDLELRLYPGLRHEILNELGRDSVYEDLLYWLEHKTGGRTV